MSAGAILLLLLAVPIVMAAFHYLRIAYKKKAATATTRGVISNVGPGFQPEDRDFWIILYWVEGQEYRIEIESNSLSYKEMILFIGDKVRVHYDPANPHRAWANVPGESDFDLLS
jgi:hypothetical protein